MKKGKNMLEQFLDSPFATSQVKNSVTQGLQNPMNALVPLSLIHI